MATKILQLSLLATGVSLAVALGACTSNSGPSPSTPATPIGGKVNSVTYCGATVSHTGVIGSPVRISEQTSGRTLRLPSTGFNLYYPGTGCDNGAVITAKSSIVRVSILARDAQHRPSLVEMTYVGPGSVTIGPNSYTVTGL